MSAGGLQRRDIASAANLSTTCNNAMKLRCCAAILAHFPATTNIYSYTYKNLCCTAPFVSASQGFSVQYR
jgi:hypothetical protein